MKKMTPLGRDVLIKCDISEKKIGRFIVATDGSREAEAPDSGIVVMLGENAFEHLDNVKPKVGDLVMIARYDGRVLDRVTEGDKSYEYRVIQDQRINAIVEEEV